MKKKRTILYVDDEVLNLELFKALFSIDYNVLISESPFDALKILEKEKVHLILTDQKMPDMTGLDFLVEVYKRFPNEPPYRILTTGYTEPERINEAFDCYKLYKSIPKPWDITLLKETISNLLNKI